MNDWPDQLTLPPERDPPTALLARRAALERQVARELRSPARRPRRFPRRLRALRAWLVSVAVVLVLGALVAQARATALVASGGSRLSVEAVELAVPAAALVVQLPRRPRADAGRRRPPSASLALSGRAILAPATLVAV